MRQSVTVFFARVSLLHIYVRNTRTYHICSQHTYSYICDMYSAVVTISQCYEAEFRHIVSFDATCIYGAYKPNTHQGYVYDICRSTWPSVLVLIRSNVRTRVRHVTVAALNERFLPQYVYCNTTSIQYWFVIQPACVKLLASWSIFRCLSHEANGI